MIREKDHGAAKLVWNMKKRIHFRVGLVGPAAAAKHPKAKMTIAELGVIHEFGTSHIPQRSFIRAAIDENIDAIVDHHRRIAGDNFRGATLISSSHKFGRWLVAQIVDRINSNIPPPLSPLTVARKGHDLALVDTGVMRESITYEVEYVRV